MNMPFIIDPNQRVVMSQEGATQAYLKPVTGKSEYAPRYKHMPVLIYSKALNDSNPKVPGEVVETPPVTRHLQQQLLQSHNTQVLGNIYSAAAIREPAFVKK